MKSARIHIRTSSSKKQSAIKKAEALTKKLRMRVSLSDYLMNREK